MDMGMVQRCCVYGPGPGLSVDMLSIRVSSRKKKFASLDLVECDRRKFVTVLGGQESGWSPRSSQLNPPTDDKHYWDKKSGTSPLAWLFLQLILTTTPRRLFSVQWDLYVRNASPV